MEFENAALQNDHLIRKWANIALVGIVSSATLEVIVQALPPHYSIAQAEGDLVIGPYGLLMNVCFFLRAFFACYLTLALLRCIKQSPLASLGLGFLAFWGACSLFLGIFNADIADSLQPLRVTPYGQIHQILLTLSFTCAPVALLLISLSFQIVYRFKPLSMPALVIAIICVISFVFLGQGGIYAHIYGIFERICVGLLLLWCALAAMHLRRPNPNNFIPFNSGKS
ncbi:MAG: DUF998 domain-containing protein [Eubacteriales bacterium]